MKNSAFKKLLKPILLLTLCTIFMGTAKAGLDYYEILVGKKLIYKRALNEPLNLKSLAISQANENEQLVINYYQCNAPGKVGSKRSITLKDENGNTIKEWKFADVKGSNAAMVIPVKELLQLQKNNQNKQLNLVYSATGREDGAKLAVIAGNFKTVGYNNCIEIKRDENTATAGRFTSSRFVM